ncbi:MAG TPA: glutamate-5-semialdehyde dehydrogenase [Firmicutes bacterium]|nr:glutamate-5-semialdehyde dehydrogenase [Bacillota bacterium]
MTVSETCRLAKEHAGAIAFSTEAEKNQMLTLAADALVAHADEIIEANKRDVAACTRGEQFRDRLMLDETRIRNIAEGLRQLIRLACPVGEVIERYTTPNGLDISRVRVPFGVVGVIYEARPNVTADAAGLCIKSGNAVVLRGSKDALASNQAIVRVMKSAIAAGGSDPEFIQLIADASHEGARAFMRQKEYLDVLIPRGSAALIQAALENATVPVIETGTGNCHVYVERTADLAMASGILCNAKTQRISVCNACESLVVDDAFAREHLDVLLLPLLERGVEIVGDERARAYMPAVGAATDEDYFKEYLAMKISVKVVSGVEEAIAWINAHSTRHSEAIITQDKRAAERFLREIDSACVYVNASTRFTDGFEFGFGAEMGISTQKLHARGPMGLRELTSYKFVIRGNGQIRE